MDEKRKGEIAYIILKDIMAKENDLPESREEKLPEFPEENIKEGSRATGIPEGELKEFFKGLMQEIVEEAFKE